MVLTGGLVKMGTRLQEIAQNSLSTNTDRVRDLEIALQKSQVQNATCYARGTRHVRYCGTTCRR